MPKAAAAPAFELTPGPSDEELREVSRLAAAQIEAERDVAIKTEALLKALRHLDDIRDRDLPDAMARCDARDFTTAAGFKVTLSEKYVSGKVATQEGLAWMAERGGGELPKTTLTIELPKGSAEVARTLIDLIRQQPCANSILKITAEEAVHNATMSSFINNLAQSGHTFMPDELEVINTYRLRRAKVGASRFKEVEIKGLEAK